MGYFVKSIVGAAVFIGCLVLFNMKLVSLLETGTCASGNVPYDIAPGYQCPDDTGRDILLLTGSIFGMLIGAGIYAFRGQSARGGRSGFGGTFGAGTFAWGLFFTATGATSLIASLTNEAIENSNGGELGGIIVGATFLVMGVPALLIALWGLVKSLSGRDERPPSAASPAGGGVMSRISAGLEQAKAAQQLSSRLPWGATPSGGGGAGGQIAKLERLAKLRESGALSEAEFEREKAKVLAE